ncbi:hypothetical protein BK706_17080 [Bacillus thuringiensis serovar leesis]|nr:hypothetical protein BK706_17080 [Bacillus thuringiensis serovar leesis]
MRVFLPIPSKRGNKKKLDVFVDGALELLSWTGKYYSMQLCSTFLKGVVVNILVTLTCVTIEPNHELKC